MGTCILKRNPTHINLSEICQRIKIAKFKNIWCPIYYLHKLGSKFSLSLFLFLIRLDSGLVFRRHCRSVRWRLCVWSVSYWVSYFLLGQWNLPVRPFALLECSGSRLPVSLWCSLPLFQWPNLDLTAPRSLSSGMWSTGRCRWRIPSGGGAHSRQQQRSSARRWSSACGGCPSATAEQCVRRSSPSGSGSPAVVPHPRCSVHWRSSRGSLVTHSCICLLHLLPLCSSLCSCV
jgi:hypothetical protein